MKDQSLNNQELKFEINSNSNSNQHRLSTSASILNRIWNVFFEWVLSLDELKIYTLKNRFGETFWKVHDPRTGRRMSFGSETEVRAWLDKRHYQ
ncbi:MAG: hypothetical protein WCD18_09925 [Thermosynechococcaceae cyanobacterium]